MLSIASSEGRSASSRRPRAFSAVIESARGLRAPNLFDDARCEHPLEASSDALLQASGRNLEPEDERGSAHRAGPQAVAARDERGAGLGELERAHHTSSVVRVHCGGCGRIDRREPSVGSGRIGVVRCLEPRSGTVLRSRWHFEIHQCSA